MNYRSQKNIYILFFFQVAHVMLKDLPTITVILPPDIVSAIPTLLEIAVTNAPLEALTSLLVKVRGQGDPPKKPMFALFIDLK